MADYHLTGAAFRAQADVHPACLPKQRTCRQCGEGYVLPPRSDGGFRNKDFCSSECKRLRPRDVPPVTCRQCRGTFVPKNRRGRPADYCSRRCKEVARVLEITPRVTKPCADCGKGFVGTAGKLYCSRQCRRLHRKCVSTCGACGREFRAAAARRFCSRACTAEANRKPCRKCGASFACADPRAKYCSTKCRSQARWMLDSLNYRTSQRLHNKRRYDLIASAEEIDPIDVFERDGWTCQTCLAPIDRSAAPRSPRSPSVDHVIPLSRGGPHAMANVRCTHFGCNSRKGNRA